MAEATPGRRRFRAGSPAGGSGLLCSSRGTEGAGSGDVLERPGERSASFSGPAQGAPLSPLPLCTGAAPLLPDLPPGNLLLSQPGPAQPGLIVAEAESQMSGRGVSAAPGRGRDREELRAEPGAGPGCCGDRLLPARPEHTASLPSSPPLPRQGPGLSRESINCILPP